MGQLGHTDARLTLGLYAQVIQRQRVDTAVIWRLMRFSDEPEGRGSPGTFETTIETTWPVSRGSEDVRIVVELRRRSLGLMVRR